MLNQQSPIPVKTKLRIKQMYVVSVITYAGPAWATLITECQWKHLEALLISHCVLAKQLPVSCETQFSFDPQDQNLSNKLFVPLLTACSTNPEYQTTPISRLLAILPRLMNGYEPGQPES